MKQNDTKKRSFRFDRDEASDDGSYSNPTHYHDQYEIYYITRGSCVYFISDRSYRLQVGDLILIPEGIIHHTVYQNLGHERLLINCSRKFIPAAFRPQGYLYRNPEITEQIRGILEEIEQEWERGDRFSEDAILCLMRLMCYLILRHPNQYETSDGENSTVSRAAEYLQGHFDRDLTLEEVAAEIPVSAAHLSRLFKKETGFGFREYLGLIRLQKAEELLKTSEGLSVAEIAARCGFSDSNYFSTKFKRVYGFSPKKLQNAPRD